MDTESFWILVFAAFIFGVFGKTDIVEKCGSNRECAEKKIKNDFILVVAAAIIFALMGASGDFWWLYIALSGGLILGYLHGLDEVNRKAEEREARERARVHGCERIKMLEKELEKVRAEMKELLHNRGKGGLVADLARQGTYAKLMDRERELEKEISELKRKYIC